MFKNVKNIIPGIIPNSKTPARYYWDNQTILVNMPVFQKLTEDERFFVLLHEAGHAELETKNELLADQFAREIYLKSGGKLSHAMNAITDNLNFSNPGSYQRAFAQFNKLYEYDQKVNNNNFLNQNITKMEIPNENLFNDFADGSMNLDILANDHREMDECDFLGIGQSKEEKQAKKKQKAANKQAKTDAKIAKKEAKAAKTQAKADAKIIKAEAKLTKAQDGGDSWFDKALGAATDIFGKDGEGSEGAGGYVPTEAPKNNNTMLIIGGVVLVVVLGVVIFFVMKKKKK